jgi:hypothetical protein
MLPAEPMPDPFVRDAPVGTRLAPRTRRELSHSVDANLFLLNYMQWVDEGGLQNSHLADFEPQRDGEPEADAAERMQAAHRLLNGISSWTDMCASVLREVHTNDALALIEHIAKVGTTWLDESGYVPDPAAWRTGTRLLLAVQCPAVHWSEALGLLDLRLAMIANTQGEYSPERMAWERGARDYPVAAIHVAAAMVAWLYGQDGVVPDHKAAIRKLAEDAQGFAEIMG